MSDTLQNILCVSLGVITGCMVIIAIATMCIALDMNISVGM